ncbi:MAG: hypothetical protein QGH74_05645, partial [Candidatus Brocadiia bacterium]|nr:hypothetical protein [Candidatus Brocadiia bacterium]
MLQAEDDVTVAGQMLRLIDVRIPVTAAAVGHNDERKGPVGIRIVHLDRHLTAVAFRVPQAGELERLYG